MTFGSCFSGIGGLDLGLEWAGLACRWQIENDPDAVEVLERHWPDVPRWGDIRDVSGEELEAVDVIAGGFPCQDVSIAGRCRGIDGERSGLWREMFRLVCEVRPRYVLVENVPGLLGRGMGRVLGDLAAIGFDAEWSVLSACAVGAPHTRERVFILAYPERQRPERVRRNGRTLVKQSAATKRATDYAAGDGPVPAAVWAAGDGPLDRVADGVSKRVGYRLLGNSVVPQVAEVVGRRLMALEAGE